MNRIYQSNYEEFANKTLYWLPMDTEELFKSNLSSKRALLEHNQWTNATITYQFNSAGFRSDEFEQQGIMFLGCSNTCGIGLPVEDMWAYQVANAVRLPYCNLGIGGGAANTAFRLAAGWIPKLSPKIVIYVEPPPMRFELIESNKPVLVISSENHSKSIDNFYRVWAMEDQNDELNYTKNYLAIQMLCLMHKARFIYLKSNDLYSCSVPNDYARDLAHCGRQTNAAFTRRVLDALDHNV
jgi:hypothetical protein